MACHNCNSFEHFKEEECSSKKIMNNCLYTAQGMYLCKNDTQDSSDNVAKNTHMMHSVQDMYNPNYARTLKSSSKSAGIWQDKAYSQ